MLLPLTMQAQTVLTEQQQLEEAQKQLEAAKKALQIAKMKAEAARLKAQTDIPNSPMNMFCNRYLLRRMFISRLWHHVRKFKAAS